jgi:hypothetical protein
MGLVDKVKPQKPVQGEELGLTSKEASFITTKLRLATYQGTEFEIFYQVMTKLQQIVENNSK